MKKKSIIKRFIKKIRKTAIYKITEYRRIDQTGETYYDGDGWWCNMCYNATKASEVNPRWKYCPYCGRKIKEWKGDR